MRIGIGYDVHALTEGRDLILGGVKVEHTMGLQGHSDAEVAYYAIASVCDAVVRTTRDARKLYPDYPVVFSGGVASNSMLRDVIKPLSPIFSQPQFSTDNAMGVAVLAYRATEA